MNFQGVQEEFAVETLYKMKFAIVYQASNCTNVLLTAMLILYTMAAGVCLSKLILIAYNMQGLNSWGMFLALILISLGCILCQQIGINSLLCQHY